MVDTYNEGGQKEGLDGMKAVCADLKGADGELDGQKFDVIIVSATSSEGSDSQLNLTAVQQCVSPFRRCWEDDEGPCRIPEARWEAHCQ